MQTEWVGVLGLVRAGLELAPVADKLAYLDPGSGSYLLQLLIAGLLGAGFVIGTSWKKVKAFFKALVSGKRRETDESPHGDA
ncbi:MAG: hypothetical protein AB1449_11900 [Chloroflexota bacterium]